MQTVTIGRIVHFTEDGQAVMPALVSHVWEGAFDLVNLHVFRSDSIMPVVLRTSVPHAETAPTPADETDGARPEGAPLRWPRYSWHWPPRT